jgi:alcohol dehydrogenase YqhD (iron-dependent ADH family)
LNFLKTKKKLLLGFAFFASACISCLVASKRDMASLISSFEFSTANRIVFGNGSIAQLGGIISSVIPGTVKAKVLLLTGKNSARAKPVTDIFEKQKIEFIAFAVGEEPTVEIASEGLQIAR